MPASCDRVHASCAGAEFRIASATPLQCNSPSTATTGRPGRSRQVFRIESASTSSLSLITNLLSRTRGRGDTHKAQRGYVLDPIREGHCRCLGRLSDPPNLIEVCRAECHLEKSVSSSNEWGSGWT